MTSPDREKRSGLKDEVLAGEYVLGALSADVNAELAKRVKTDRQFAAMVRRWQENLGHTTASEHRSFSYYMNASTDRALRRQGDRLNHGIYGRFAILSAVWNSVRFWRLTTSAALLWAAVLLFSVA